MAIKSSDIQDAMSVGEDMAKVKNEQKRLYEMLTLVIMVLLVGFFGVSATIAAIVMDGFRVKEATYSDLQHELWNQNNSIQTLIQLEQEKRATTTIKSTAGTNRP